MSNAKNNKHKKKKEKRDESDFNNFDKTLGSIYNTVRQGTLSLHESAMTTDMAKSGKSLDQLANAFIDENENASDLYGDGDQSPVKADFPTDPGQRLRDMWSNSGDFYTIVQTTGSPFMKACFMGEAQNVKKYIDAVIVIEERGDEGARTRLLELRESTLRFSPLMSCICGAKNKNFPSFSARLKNAQHYLVAEYLCAAGARVDAKDVAGYTCCHQATSLSGCIDSVAIFRLLAHKYGADPRLRNRFDATPLNSALMTHREELVEALLAHGAQVH